MLNDADKAFQLALSQFWEAAKWGRKTEIAASADLTQGYINNLAQGRRAGTEKSRRAIAAALGFPVYEDFLDLGRRALGLPTASKSAALPPSPEVAGYLEKARAVLEKGGPNAEALKTILCNMKE